MILLINSASNVFELSIVIDSEVHAYTWQSDRQLAKGMLGYVRDRLADHDATFHDVAGIGVFQGPGSFTGLRIGITVANTLAESLGIPIVGLQGDDWRVQALHRLAAGESDKIVLPEYGGDAHITQPRK